MKIKRSIYKGQPVISFSTDTGIYILTLGTLKAKAVVENIDEIKIFLKENSKDGFTKIKSSDDNDL